MCSDGLSSITVFWHIYKLGHNFASWIRRFALAFNGSAQNSSRVIPRLSFFVPQAFSLGARSAPLRPTRVYLDNEGPAPFALCGSSPCTRVARALSD